MWHLKGEEETIYGNFSGLWKLEIYFNEELFGEIVINIEDS
jgi:hypothetical protein